MDVSKNQYARRLIDEIATRYGLLSEMLSFFQAGFWRRFLVSRLGVGPEDTVLDICTGAAGVAVRIARTHGNRVAGVEGMQA
jgi:ubiquinone/menaquinone biosynthesis C-methylase UbiE